MTTTSAIRHLERLDGHNLVDIKKLIAQATDENLTPFELSRRQQARAKHTSFLSKMPPARPSDDANKPTRAALELMKRCIVEMVACCDFPITLFEAPAFRQFCYLMNPTMAAEILPGSDTTMYRWLTQAFDENLVALRAQLYEAVSKIHLSADIWTSPNKMGLLAVVAHYVDSHYRLRTRLIALRHVVGSHSGENIQFHLSAVIRDFHLEERLGWFTFDNDDSNDKGLRLVFQALYGHNGQRASQEVIQRRCRCWAHTINLFVKPIVVEGDVEEWRDFDDGDSVEVCHLRERERERGSEINL